MRYKKGDNITFKTTDGVIHNGLVIDIEPNVYVGAVYIIETIFGNYARLTEEEVD